MLAVQRATILSLSLFVVSCSAGQPIDCVQANRDVFDCFEANPSALEEGRYDRCIPHSRALTITGIWVSDFEWNQFHEDGGELPTDLELDDFKRYVEILPELTSSDALSEIDGDGGSVIGRIRFIGRRPLCSPYPGSASILVDRVLSWETLETGPSGSITYGPDAN